MEAEQADGRRSPPRGGSEEECCHNAYGRRRGVFASRGSRCIQWRGSSVTLSDHLLCNTQLVDVFLRLRSACPYFCDIVGVVFQPAPRAYVSEKSPNSTVLGVCGRALSRVGYMTILRPPPLSRCWFTGYCCLISKPPQQFYDIPSKLYFHVYTSDCFE